MTPKHTHLYPFPPRGLSRPQAAAHIGVSPVTFDAMVAIGEMPPPKRSRASNRLIWDRLAVERALEDLPDAEPVRPRSEVWGNPRA
jgi:hypothetical protein